MRLKIVKLISVDKGERISIFVRNNENVFKQNGGRYASCVSYHLFISWPSGCTAGLFKSWQNWRSCKELGGVCPDRFSLTFPSRSFSCDQICSALFDLFFFIISLFSFLSHSLSELSLRLTLPFSFDFRPSCAICSMESPLLCPYHSLCTPNGIYVRSPNFIGSYSNCHFVFIDGDPIIFRRLDLTQEPHDVEICIGLPRQFQISNSVLFKILVDPARGHCYRGLTKPCESRDFGSRHTAQ